MGPELYVAAALAVLALGSVLSLVQLRRLRRDRDRALAELAATRAESRELTDRVEALARRVAPRDEPTEFVITDIGAATGPVGTSPAGGRRQVEPYVDGRLFADIVLRESVVRAASLAHGVRRALRPETRHRIRFEMRREIKRARRQRRDDLKELRRELQARQRAREVA
jgi:hypothetical protein